MDFIALLEKLIFMRGQGIHRRWQQFSVKNSCLLSYLTYGLQLFANAGLFSAANKSC